jgi:hypothetical protein
MLGKNIADMNIFNFWGYQNQKPVRFKILTDLKGSIPN